MNSRRTALSALALATAAALLAGCGNALSADSGSGGSTSISVGVNGNVFDMSLQVAQANGYFKKQGLTVKFVTLTASTAPAALQSNSVQFLNESPTGFFTAIGKGLTQTAIAANAGGNPLGLVVSTKFAKAHSLSAGTPADQVAKALAGSTGGASSANTKAEASIYLKKYGVDPAKLKWVSLPSPAADKAALNNNEIDWFVTSEPIPLQIQDEGDGIVVADPIKVPQWSVQQAGYGQLVVAEKSYLKAHADIAKKFVAAVNDGLKYIAANQKDEKVLAAGRKALPGTPDSVLQGSIDQVEWPQTGAMTAADLDKTRAFIESLGTLKEVKLTSDDWTNKYLP
jgi:ABC-type nitrate/sulfonate/bicarbonate transport system substrate-binding protein